MEKQKKAASTDEMLTVNHNHKTPMRSLMMIGGNDVLGGAVTASLFPYLGNDVIEQVAENISFITYRHIENGKQILLLGTIPIKSEAIGPYDYTIADRESLCHPVTDLLIQPEEFPWWVCGFGPGICVAALTGAAAHNQQIIDAFDNFQHELFYGCNSDPAVLANINQACIKDCVTQIGNVYSEVYPNNVFIRALYNSFNNTGSGIKTANFWVPQEAMYEEGGSHSYRSSAL